MNVPAAGLAERQRQLAELEARAARVLRRALEPGVLEAGRRPPRHAAAQQLVERAAAVLGVPAAPVFMDERARARTEAHGTHAVMADRAILLHPDRFDPARGDALEIVVHELVHVAQLGVDSRRVDPRGDLDAETEASTIAAQVAAGVVPDGQPCA